MERGKSWGNFRNARKCLNRRKKFGDLFLWNDTNEEIWCENIALLAGSGYSLVAGSYKHGHKTSGSIKCVDFIYHFGDYQLPNKDPNPCN
jgi:hypothetical protein